MDFCALRGVTRQLLAEHGWNPLAQELATALNRHLDVAVDQVRSAWDAGEPAPLSLRPLYRTWEAMRPNSGLLIHRLRQEPGDLYHFHLGMDEPEIPRGLPVPEFLVPGLIQVVGHTRTRRVHRLVGIWQGQEPPYQTAGLPLALDLLPEDSWWLAPLTERQGEPALARIIYSDVGMGGTPTDYVQLVELIPGSVILYPHGV